MFRVGVKQLGWTEKGVISFEEWEKDAEGKSKKPPEWDPEKWGKEPAWFGTDTQKVVTGADYAGESIPSSSEGAVFPFICIKLVNSSFEVRTKMEAVTFVCFDSPHRISSCTRAWRIQCAA
jgi:hypothetical protein